jgi:PAS domain S-box-containing protein
MNEEVEMASRRQHDTEHEQILKEMLEQFGPVFEQSPDGIYLYLDDVHKICNERLARMFGLTTKEWASTPTFLRDFVDEQDQELVARNYQNHVAVLTRPVRFRFRAKRKDGSEFKAETDMIPISWRGNPVAYHFVREVKD